LWPLMVVGVGIAIATPRGVISQAVEVCNPNAPSQCLAPDAGGSLPISASVTGFAPAATGTPITATTGGVTGTLPAGAVVLVQNTGSTNVAYCKLGASATVDDIAIPPQSTVAFTRGVATQLTCITSASTTVINMTGGSGLATGWGGGSSTGGGGGSNAAASATGAAVPAAAGYTGFNSGGNLVGVSSATPLPVEGVGLAQGSVTAGQQGSMIMGAVTTAAPTYSNAQTSPFSLDTGGRMRVTHGFADPCLTTEPTRAAISITSATTTRIVAPSASNRVYICYLYMQTGAANNVAVIEGTGGTCGAGTAALVGGTTSTNGLNNAANSGQAFVKAGMSALRTAGTNVDLCLITSSAGPLAGTIQYVLAP
jgi:hypothetical protein